MGQTARISFAIQPFESVLAVVPILSEIPLTELVRSFESAQGYKPAGDYGGLIPHWFNYGPLNRYFLGDFDSESYFGRRGNIYLLGCSCGEVGCWPLAASVKASVDTIEWDSFQQPHRPEWDYSQFGPFIFESNAYRQAVADLQADFSTRVLNVERDC